MRNKIEVFQTHAEMTMTSSSVATTSFDDLFDELVLKIFTMAARSTDKEKVVNWVRYLGHPNGNLSWAKRQEARVNGEEKFILGE